MADPSFDERGFRQWFDPTVKKLGLSPDPDDPESYYDYRGFYKAMRAGKYKSPTQEGQHWPSEFKAADHPRVNLRDPVENKFFNTETGNYLNGTPVSEDRMNYLNDADLPTLSPTDQALAKAGFTESHPGAVPALIGAKDEWKESLRQFPSRPVK